MTCQMYQGMLVDEAYGEPDAAGASGLRAHLACCACCRRVQAELFVMRGVALSVPVTEVTRAEWPWMTGVFAGVLSFLSLYLLSKSPHFDLAPRGASLFLFVAWSGLYAWLFGLVQRVPGAGPSVRAVLYGVLVAVAASLGSLWVTLTVGARLYRLIDMVADFSLMRLLLLALAGTLLLVGIGLGLVLKEKTRPNVPWVLSIYLLIMLPVLLALPTGRQTDLLFASALLLLWGLSGAYMGSFLGGVSSNRLARPS